MTTAALAALALAMLAACGGEAMGASAEIRFYSAGPNQVYATELVRSGEAGRLGRRWVGHSAEGETADTVEVLPGAGNRGVMCEWGEGMIGFSEVPFGARRVQRPGPDIALVVAQRGLPAADHRVSVACTAESKRMWAEQAASPGVGLVPSTFAGMGDAAGPLPAEADLLARVRTGRLFPRGADGRWSCFPVAELHETNDRACGARDGDARLWKGESFGQYDPHGYGERSLPPTDALMAKVRKPRPGSGSLLAPDLPVAERRRAVLADISRDRLCLRDVTNRANSRTVVACMVPKGVFLTNNAPYLSFPTGDAMARAACLGAS